MGEHIYIIVMLFTDGYESTQSVCNTAFKTKEEAEAHVEKLEAIPVDEDDIYPSRFMGIMELTVA